MKLWQFSRISVAFLFFLLFSCAFRGFSEGFLGQREPPGGPTVLDRFFLLPSRAVLGARHFLSTAIMESYRKTS